MSAPRRPFKNWDPHSGSPATPGQDGRGLRRRDLLKAGVGCGLVLAARPLAALTATSVPPVPRVNGGINVQPLRRFEQNAGLTDPLIVPELVDLQMRLLYELGFETIRLTISFDRFGPDFLASIPYVRAARSLGIDVIGILGQFGGFDLVQALSRADTFREVLNVYLEIFDRPILPASSDVSSGAFSLQVLNEPTSFLGISPSTYVRSFLRPVFDHVKRVDPSLTVVSAAAIGSAEGLLRTRQMLEAGVEDFCDRLAYHIYDRDAIPFLANLASKPVWVTESGVAGPERHLGWITDTFEEIRSRIRGVELIYYFDLFDFEPNRFRLIDIVPRSGGGFESIAESTEALELLATRVDEASGVQPRAAYRDLVPDITLHFPTQDDLDLIAATSFGAMTWRF